MADLDTFHATARSTFDSVSSGLNRRLFLTGCTAATTICHPIAAMSAVSGAINQIDRLVLLGTRGGPVLTSEGRTPAANLLVHNNIPYLVDTGYGVSLKLIAAGIALTKLRHIFITHHHSDHNLELGPLLYNAWVSGLDAQIVVHGPSGLQNLVDRYWQSMAYDVTTRIADEGRPDPKTLISVREFEEGVVLRSSDVVVTALRNHHPPITDSFALRFDFPGKRVVFSGDTSFLPQLADFAREAEYLIHEAFYPKALDAMLRLRPNATRLGASIRSHHTTAEDVGRIASAARAKTLVLSHFVPADEKLVTERMWFEAVRKIFDGRIIIGHDMLNLNL